MSGVMFLLKMFFLNVSFDVYLHPKKEIFGSLLTSSKTARNISMIYMTTLLFDATIAACLRECVFL